MYNEQAEDEEKVQHLIEELNRDLSLRDMKPSSDPDQKTFSFAKSLEIDLQPSAEDKKSQLYFNILGLFKKNCVVSDPPYPKVS